MSKIFIYAIGCEQRSLDAQKISNYLSKNNHKIIYNPKKADIIIFITCAFIDRLENFSLNKIEDFKKLKGELIVAGCLPSINKESLSNIFKGKTLSTKELDKIDSIFPNHKIKFKDIDDANKFPLNIDEKTLIGLLTKIFSRVRIIGKTYSKFKNYIYSNIFKERNQIIARDFKNYKVMINKKFYHIRTSDGCVNNCSYCAIKKAIRPFQSKPLKQCLNELEKGIKIGYKNIVLDADDVGVWGIDIESNLPELLDEMTKNQEDYKIYLRSLNPRWFVKYIDQLEDIVKRKKIAHMYIALQSGSPRILKLMKRYSDVEKLKNAFIRLKKIDPNLIYDTDIIIGFPTETKEDFMQTLNFIRDAKIDTGLGIAFSCKTGTKAEEIEPKIDEKEILKRMNLSKKYLKQVGYKIISLPNNLFVFYKRK